MAGTESTFHQNFALDKKNNDVVEKDIRKWVESVVEFKANQDKQRGEEPVDKNAKKNKKFKTKKKSNMPAVPTKSAKNPPSGQRKTLKSKKGEKKAGSQTAADISNKDQTEATDAFAIIRDTYRKLKLPQNWTSGLSGNRIIFNRVKVTTQNAQQKMAVERSLVITKDCNVHILINGSEINLSNWEMNKVDTIDDIKRAIKEVDSLRLCDGLVNGTKSPQCTTVIDSKIKICQACKSEMSSPVKTSTKKTRTSSKTGGTKGVSKQKSFQT